MAALAPKPRYVYTQEIASMVFVCTGIKDPDEELAQYLEDVVGAEMAELVTQARAQAVRRAVRTIAVEDLVFLVRHDRAKVNRLRSYLSWRDVRKKLKEPNEADDEIDGMEEPVSDKTLKVIKNTVRLPWELSDAWVDYLRGEDEPEDHEAEAYEVNKQRLKEMDEVTHKMSKDEYEQYAQARQASFVYRKGKKFRDFLSLPSLLDTVAPLSDEVMDVLGFLAYECVRALCDAGSANRALLNAAEARAKEEERRREVREGKKRGREGDDGAAEEGASPEKDAEGAAPASPARKKPPPRKGLEAPTTINKAPPPSPTRKPLEIPTSLFSAPLSTAEAAPALAPAPAPAGGAHGAPAETQTLLQLQDVAQGYHAVRHAQGALKMGGMRNWRGGVARLSNRLL
ncbi:Transcription initiation protein spt3 [Rhodotorula kratochvilovae]